MTLRGLGGTVAVCGLLAAFVMNIPGGACPISGMDNPGDCSPFGNEARLVVLASASFLVLCFLADGVLRLVRRVP